MVEAIGSTIGAGIRAGGAVVGIGARAVASGGAEAVRTAGPNVLRSIGTVTARVPEHAVKNIGGVDLAPKQIGSEAGYIIKSPNIANTLRISRLQDELNILRLQGLNGASKQKPTYVFIPEQEDEEIGGIVGLIIKIFSFVAKALEFGLDTGEDGISIVKDPRVQKLLTQ